MTESVFSYVVTHDSGFAPNPFGGFLSLATCKPKIRASANVGDWIVGTASAKLAEADRVIYVAKITEVVPLELYGSEGRFAIKRPQISGEAWRRHGDNIYFKDRDGVWRQRRNPHHQADGMARDLGGQNALICPLFWYFGSLFPALPDALRHMVKTGPGHKRLRDTQVATLLGDWLRGWAPGIVTTERAIRDSAV
jgi:hypothetical protein